MSAAKESSDSNGSLDQQAKVLFSDDSTNKTPKLDRIDGCQSSEGAFT